MEKNLKKYIAYLNKNDNLTDVVAIINVGSNNKWYTNTKKTDLNKGHLMLTNKFYYLDNTGHPSSVHLMVRWIRMLAPPNPVLYP